MIFGFIAVALFSPFTAWAITIDPSVNNLARSAQIFQSIKYSQTYKDLPPRIKDFLFSVWLHNHRIFHDMSQIEFPSGHPGIIAVVGPQIKPSHLTEYQSEFWQQLREKYSDLVKLSDFSRENYYRFMIEELPKITAEYGILTFLVPFTVADPKQNIYQTEVELVFYPVTSIASRSFDEWSCPINVDVITIEDQLELYGCQFNDFQRPMHGFCYHGNIFYFPADYSANETDCYAKPSDFDLMKTDGRNGIWQRFWAASAGNRQEIIRCAAACVLLKINNQIVDPADRLQSALAHEVGHLADDHQHPDLLNSLLVTGPVSIPEFESAHLNQVVHEENGGFISQIRYSKNKTEVIFDLIDAYDYVETNPYSDGYSSVQPLICTYFIDFIIDDCLKWRPQYGFKVDFHRPNIRGQVLMQFERFLDHPEILEALADRLMQLHVASGYSPKYVNYQSRYLGWDTPAALKSRLQARELRMITVILVIAVFIFVILLKYLFRQNQKKKKKNKRKK